MLIPRRLFEQWPQHLVRSFPDVFGKCVFKSIDHGFYTVVDIAQGLVGVEVTASPGKVLVFKETISSQILIKKEAQGRSNKFSDAPIYLVISLSRIPILCQESVQESFCAIEKFVTRLKCIRCAMRFSQKELALY